MHVPQITKAYLSWCKLECFCNSCPDYVDEILIIGNYERIVNERQKVRGQYKAVDDFDKYAIRQKIHKFYTVRRQLPTIDRLYESLKCDINIPGSKSLLKIVKELGFKWKRSQTKRKVLIEKDAIVEKRIKYLHRIKDYREKDTNLVYIDETWIDTAYTAKKLAEITVSDWEKTCRHVANIEDEYRKRDIVIDEQMESLIIDLVDSSDSESDNDDNV
ncbi:unnamed protein product [Mytilus coruscus]|uniref:Uncharacterized protein n=1 Tax=Mytilus coruscus TaxID=42192 RepID=A0A6J8DFP6_MYTCO|nr:unnamed protein product [Mytilus coruscus]